MIRPKGPRSWGGIPPPPSGEGILSPPRGGEKRSFSRGEGPWRRAARGWLGLGQARPPHTHSSSQHRMRSDCPLGLSLAGGSGLMAAVLHRCRGEGVSLVFTGRRSREPKTPAVGLRSRRCVVKPDPITPHGKSSRGVAEGEGRFPTAIDTLRSLLGGRFPRVFATKWEHKL